MTDQAQAMVSDVTQTKDIERLYFIASNAADVLADKVGNIEEFIARCCGSQVPPREVPKQPEAAGSLGTIENALNKINNHTGRLVDAVDLLDRIG